MNSHHKDETLSTKTILSSYQYSDIGKTAFLYWNGLQMFYKEINPSSTKLPLKFNGGSVEFGLTYLEL